ncbi:MAG TPA: divalent-cation tolerance protein CutA [Burkholderiales bacterium]|nr:divalent-cation tolerance protein CutA [Burkholderiales bacterium]
MNDRDIVVVLTNMPDRASATRLATLLVDEGHAACVNVLAGCESIYRWQGRIETTAEVPLLIKAAARAYPALEEAIRRHHPYELPEIVSLPVGAALPGYADWVVAQTSRESGGS